MAKQVFIHTRLSRAYLALAGFLVSSDIKVGNSNSKVNVLVYVQVLFEKIISLMM